MDSLRIKSKISRLTAARREGTAAVARVAWRWGERTLTALAAAGHGLTPPEMAAARALARWYAAQDARVDAERRARVEERARARGYASEQE